MADRGDTHYKIPTLNQWFFWSSLFLLVSVVWTVIDDWNAEWKTYQRSYRELLLEKAEAARAELESEGVVAEAESLTAAVDAANAALSAQRQDLAAAKTTAYEAKEEQLRVEQLYKGRKGADAWDRLLREEDIVYEDADVSAEAREYDERLVETYELELQYEQKTKDWEAAQAKVDGIRSDVIAAEKALSGATRDLSRVDKQIETYAPSELTVKAANVIRDFPGLDFIGPNLNVSKQVLTDLTFELNFTKKTRIDMCTTCHQGIDNAEMAAEKQPYSTHPRLDLFLTSKSKHPLTKVGCTICHRGSGESLSFQHADHRPSDAEESEAWHHEHEWHKQHHWDYPMLSSDYVEAGCVQCHTTSMELIAEDAPTVTRGMRLFEQKACYACHKVEWFPTKRKPGPSLKHLASKLQPEFVESWIANPKSFRARTNMPQVFHLENYAPDEVIVQSDYGKGEAILGEAWNTAAVAAITHYLYEMDASQELEPIPVEGDPERGREAFRLAGCLACHNLEAHPGEQLALADPAQEVNEFNSMGPNLRGVASKLNATWLYHWVKDPTSYWEGTRMPNLRLSDQDAADITAYIMEDPDGTFHDVPAGWEPESRETDLLVLQEQSRWFYGKLGRIELDRRLKGENSEFRWDQEGPLKTAVGEAWIRNQGCFSCHLVSGMENDMPVGTELTNWGSKTVDKLDFGLTDKKEVGGLPKLDHHYREAWLERKLRRPRVYDLDRIKNPKEKLRMPFFDLSEEEAQAIATFVVGLVDNEVSAARMNPDAEKAGMDQGMRVVRQKNCMACHVVEPGTITYKHESGSLLTIQASLPPLDGSELPLELVDLPTLQADLAAWSERMDEDYPEDLLVQLLGLHPDVGVPGDKLAIMLEDLVAISPARGGSFVSKVTDYYYHGVQIPDPEHTPDLDPEDDDYIPAGQAWTIGYDESTDRSLIEDVDGVPRAYAEEPYDRIRWAFAPPVLWNEGHKLQREWFYSFLKDPAPIRRQIRVRMPSFRFEPGEAESVADYFASKARKDWYKRYARSARWTHGREQRADLSNPDSHRWSPVEEREWPTAALTTERGPGIGLAELTKVMQASGAAGLSKATLANIEAGDEVDTLASFSKFYDWARADGFGMVGMPSDSYEAVLRRQPSHRAQHPDGPGIGRAVGVEGVNCYSCHPNGETYPPTPISWAPRLQIVRERLREDWVYEWLWNPSLVYPGTAMAANFSTDAPQWQTQYPDSTNAEQVEAVLEWLFNMDQLPSASN